MPASKRVSSAKTPATLERVRALSSLANLFVDYLPLSLHLVQPGRPGLWHALAPLPSGLQPVQFEIFFNTVTARYAFHSRSLAKVTRSGKLLEAEHFGIWDMVVPVGREKEAVFAGPYLTELPDAPWLERRFSQVSGNRPAAPEVQLAYARAVLGTAVLPAQARQGLAFACRFAAEWYLKGRGPAADDLEALKPLLARRVPWRMERFAEARRERLLWWAAQSQGLASWDVRDFGLKRLPGAVLAFLPAVSGSDAIQDLLLAARLRQAAFHLAVERGYIAGRALGEGACLLVPAEAKGRRSNEALAELGRDTASWLGRKLGVPVCAAWSLALGGEYLPEAFRQAEWALLTGLAAGRRLSPYGSGHGGGADPVLDSYEAGKALEQAVVSGRTAELNAAKEAALGSAGRLFPGRSDLLRPELLRLSLQLFDAVKRRGLLEGPAFETQRREALASLQKAHNTRELAGAFSNLVDKLGLLAVSPRSGSSRLRVRQVQRTLDEEELPPALTAAARLAGLSASRFSRLYSRESGEGYGAQRRRKRLAVAAQLLLQGRLPIWRVAHESGYRSPSHFVQAFKRAYGKTPADYRREAQEKG